MVKFQISLESPCQNLIRRPEIFLIPLCNRTSIKSIVTILFPFCFLYHCPAHRGVIPELAIQFDVIPGRKFDIIRNMIE
jgi:hypothetical protein